MKKKIINNFSAIHERVDLSGGQTIRHAKTFYKKLKNNIRESIKYYSTRKKLIIFIRKKK